MNLFASQMVLKHKVRSRKLALPVFYLSIIIIVYGCSAKWTDAIQRGYTVNKEFRTVVEVKVINGLIFMPVSIHGEVYNFLFDTGAPFSISEELQEKMSFKTVSRGRIVDSDDNARKVDYVAIDSISIDGIPFSDFTAFVGDFKANPILNCLGIDGIIGSNLIRCCNWSIDYQNKEITLSNRQADSLNKDAFKIPFYTDFQYNMLVDLNVGGVALKNLTIDYGSNGSLSLPDHIFQSLKQKGAIDITFNETGFSQSGIIGKPTWINREIAFVDTISSGNLTIEDVKVKSGGSGLIGIKILSRFVVTVNWNERTLHFAKVDSAGNDNKTFGFQMGYDAEKRFYVQSVVENSPAFIAGLQPNMRVLKFDSMEVAKGYTFCDFLDYAENLSDRLALEVVLDNGEIKYVTLEKKLLVDQEEQ